MSARLMLEWLAEKYRDGAMKEASGILWDAIVQTLRKKIFTPDLGGSSTTKHVANAVIEEITKAV
jgi:isocitrate/isopropylmalate dehydrogenase